MSVRLVAVTKTTARVLTLLEILQSGGTRTGSELARRLEVDNRTIRRYVGQLIELDVPVQTIRGRYGGYRLAPGVRMPPLMLTSDEAVAVSLGLLSVQRGRTTSTAAAESALAKLQRVLPKDLRGRFDDLVRTAALSSVAGPSVDTESGVVLQFAEAVRSRHSVAIAYIDADGRRSRRIVQPYGIVAHAGRWYLTGADSLSRAIRIFRLDRISDADTLTESFVAPADFDPVAHVLDAIAGTPYRHRISIRFQGRAEDVATRLPPGIALVEAILDRPGWVRARIRAAELDWVPAVLAGTGLPFVVEDPVELGRLVRALGENLVAAGQGFDRTQESSRAQKAAE